MGTKSLIFLWLVLIGLLGYICITQKVGEIYAGIDQEKIVPPKVKDLVATINEPTPTVAKPKEEIVSVKKEQIIVKNLKDPSFAFVSGEKDKVACFLSEKDRDSAVTKEIDELCSEGCIKEIKYLDDVKKMDFVSDIGSFIKFSKEKKIKDFALYIDKDELKIEGSYEDKSIKDKIAKLLVPFMNRGYNITDNTKVVKVEKPVVQNIEVVKPKIEPEKPKVEKVLKTILEPKKVETPINSTKKSELVKPKVVPTVLKKTIHKRVYKDVIVKDVFEESGVERDPEILQGGEIVSTKGSRDGIVAKDVYQELSGDISPKEEIIEEKIEQAPPTPVEPKTETAQSVEVEIDSMLEADPIRFELKSSILTKESRDTLNEVVNRLLTLDNIKIEVAGYTDAVGDATYNKVLSQKRADSVRNYLIKSGIRRERVRSIGYGEANPIGDPRDIINRRVEIHISEVK